MKGIAESRNIPVDSINALANRFDFYTTRQFQDFGFFDGVLYEDQMLALLKEKCGVGSSDPLNQIALTDYQNASVPEVPIEFNKDKIAVVYASGEIGLEQKNNTIGPGARKNNPQNPGRQYCESHRPARKLTGRQCPDFRHYLAGSRTSHTNQTGDRFYG